MYGLGWVGRCEVGWGDNGKCRKGKDGGRGVWMGRPRLERDGMGWDEKLALWMWMGRGG